MAPIIPSGGQRMSWVNDPEPIQKKAQENMFDDDPQLSAIKDLPGMQDGIAELQDMTTNMAPPMDVPPTDVPPVDVGVAGTDGTGADSAVGGAVEKAIEKVKDAAEGVVDAVKKDVQTAIGDAVQNVGQPAEVAPVSDNIDEIKPDVELGECDGTGKGKGDGKCNGTGKSLDDIPGVEGEKDGKVEKEGDKDDDKDNDKDDDKDDKDDKPAFAAATGMRRLADMSASEVKDLRHYWKDLLGFPPEYVDSMLKKYRA